MVKVGGSMSKQGFGRKDGKIKGVNKKYEKKGKGVDRRKF